MARTVVVGGLRRTSPHRVEHRSTKPGVRSSNLRGRAEPSENTASVEQFVARAVSLGLTRDAALALRYKLSCIARRRVAGQRFDLCAAVRAAVGAALGAVAS